MLVRTNGGESSKNQRGKIRVDLGTIVDQREKEELESTVRSLEDKLREVNRAEKPLEETEQQDKDSEETSSKAIKNAEEVARYFYYCQYMYNPITLSNC